MGGLRFRTQGGTCGRLRTKFVTARAPYRRATDADPGPDENRAKLQALRDDVESLRAEVERLSDIVAADPADPAFDRLRPEQPAASVLRRAAAASHLPAIDRVDEAVSDFLRAASDPPDFQGDWHRTDAAVADLLLALTKQANSEREKARAHRAAANGLRLDRQLVRLQQERAALRKFRARWWWRWALR